MFSSTGSLTKCLHHLEPGQSQDSGTPARSSMCMAGAYAPGLPSAAYQVIVTEYPGLEPACQHRMQVFHVVAEPAMPKGSQLFQEVKYFSSQCLWACVHGLWMLDFLPQSSPVISLLPTSLSSASVYPPFASMLPYTFCHTHTHTHKEKWKSSLLRRPRRGSFAKTFALIAPLISRPRESSVNLKPSCRQTPARAGNRRGLRVFQWQWKCWKGAW